MNRYSLLLVQMAACSSTAVSWVGLVLQTVEVENTKYNILNCAEIEPGPSVEVGRWIRKRWGACQQTEDKRSTERLAGTVFTKKTGSFLWQSTVLSHHIIWGKKSQTSFLFKGFLAGSFYKSFVFIWVSEKEPSLAIYSYANIMLIASCWWHWIETLYDNYILYLGCQTNITALLHNDSHYLVTL